MIGHVLKGGVHLMIVGLFLGLAGALAIARLLTSELYQVSSYGTASVPRLLDDGSDNRLLSNIHLNI